MVRVFWFPSGLQYAKRMGLNPVLDRASILFIKSEFHCGRFAPLRNSSILVFLMGTLICYSISFGILYGLCQLGCLGNPLNPSTILLRVGSFPHEIPYFSKICVSISPLL